MSQVAGETTENLSTRIDRAEQERRTRFGQALRDARGEIKLIRIAARLDRSESTLSRWEAGERWPGDAGAVIEAYVAETGADANELVRAAGSMPIKPNTLVRPKGQTRSITKTDGDLTDRLTRIEAKLDALTAQAMMPPDASVLAELEKKVGKKQRREAAQ